MKLSKRRYAKRSYRKGSPKKRASYRKKRASYRKKRSTGRRTRLSFRFGDSIDPVHMNIGTVGRAQESLQARLKRIRDILADDPIRLEIVNNDLNAIRHKYFGGYLGRYNDNLQGNDAVEFVCEKLNVTPQRLFRLIPSISELDPDYVTTNRIKLLLTAYTVQEMNNYLDNFER